MKSSKDSPCCDGSWMDQPNDACDTVMQAGDDNEDDGKEEEEEEDDEEEDDEGIEDIAVAE